MTVTAKMVFRELFDGHLIVIVLFLFFMVWNSLKALLLCLFSPRLAAVTVLF